MRTVGATVDREAFQAMPYGLVASPTGTVTLTASVYGSQLAGTQVTFGVTTTGGSGPLQYQFWLRKAGGGWQVARAYTSDNSWIWDTTGLASGVYSVGAGVRAGGPGSGESFSLPLTYPIASPTVTSVTVNATPPGPQPYGTSVTFAATATEGIGPIQYRFRRFSRSGTLEEVRGYSTSTVWTWDNTALYSGNDFIPHTFWIEVSARSAGSTADNEAILTVPYHLVVPPATGISFSASPASPVVRGAHVLFSASATGGIPPYLYKFVVRNGSGTILGGEGEGIPSTFTCDTTGYYPEQRRIAGCVLGVRHQPPLVLGHDQPSLRDVPPRILRPECRVGHGQRRVLFGLRLQVAGGRDGRHGCGGPGKPDGLEKQRRLDRHRDRGRPPGHL